MDVFTNGYEVAAVIAAFCFGLAAMLWAAK